MIIKQTQSSIQTRNKIFCVGLVIFLGVGLMCLPHSAWAAPQFLVSWKANDFVPAWYQGKVLPTKNTQVIVNFELIDSGKIVNLSGAAVRWYVNDGLMKNENNGLGIKSLTFNMPDYAGSETEVRISLPNYKSQALDYIVNIPVAAPETVIDNPSPDGKISVPANIFIAYPFFFNVGQLSELSFNWTANGQESQGASGAPWILNLNLDSATPSGFGVNLQCAITNLGNQTEVGNKQINLETR